MRQAPWHKRHKKEACKRAQAYYWLNRDKISDKRKADRKLLKELKKICGIEE